MLVFSSKSSSRSNVQSSFKSPSRNAPLLVCASDVSERERKTERITQVICRHTQHLDTQHAHASVLEQWAKCSTLSAVGWHLAPVVSQSGFASRQSECHGDNVQSSKGESDAWCQRAHIARGPYSQYLSSFGLIRPVFRAQTLEVHPFEESASFYSDKKQPRESGRA